MQIHSTLPGPQAARGRETERRHSCVLGLGMYVPERVVTNEELAPRLGTTPQDIVQRCGVRERRFVEPGQGTSHLAHQASLRALSQAGLQASDLDLIIMSTLSPDHLFPGAGFLLQEKLGLVGTPVLDLRNQCAGFIHTLVVADQFIRAATYDHVLAVGAEVHSSGLDFSPRGAAVTILFGDGAGAAVVGPSPPDRGLLASRLHADGRYARDLWVPAPGSEYPEHITCEQIAAGLHYPHMTGSTVFRAAVACMSDVTRQLVDDVGASLDDIGLFVFHQANLRILEAVIKRLGIDPTRVHCNLDRYGNTTAASIPIALAEAAAQGRVRPGDLVALVAFGSGFSWGGVIYRW